MKVDGKRAITMAWMTARFIKGKLPSLQSVLHPVARKLEGEELARRQAEHEAMMKEIGS